MSNPQRPSNMLIRVFTSIAVLFALFIIAAIVNNVAKEFQGNNQKVSRQADRELISIIK